MTSQSKIKTPEPKSKKRKHAGASDSSPSVPKMKKKKRESRASSSAPSEFCTIHASTVLSVPPVFANDLRGGVEEMLDSMIMRYIPSLQGVLVAHSNIRFLDSTAAICGDCPFAICNVGFDATVWSPRVAMKLVGKINLCSPDHVSLLVHRTFNVSIPRHHISQDQWVFEYGPAENDPEFGTGRHLDDETQGGEEITGASADLVMQDVSPGETSSSAEKVVESSGWWVHHLTGKRLGEPDGYLEFTVIGLTVANEMLSLQGSIQPDPFSPEHVPHRPNDSRASTPSSRASHHPYVTASSAPTGAKSSVSVVRRNDDADSEAEEAEDETFGEDAFEDLLMLDCEEAERQRREVERIEKTSKKRKRTGGESVAQEIGGDGNKSRTNDKQEKKRRKKRKGEQDAMS
ncbi:hypothetical protein ID866_2465 [Astraeus odoratus]|nr:hypothetical protein ID866_2465 [Astraeus odoratus]